MKKKKRNPLLFIIALLVLAIAFAVIYFSNEDSVYKSRVAEEELTTIDFYSMQEYCSQNAAAVMDALKTGNTKKLETLMIDPAGADALMSFADWKNADFENASVSFAFHK